MFPSKVSIRIGNDVLSGKITIEQSIRSQLSVYGEHIIYFCLSTSGIHLDIINSLGVIENVPCLFFSKKLYEYLHNDMRKDYLEQTVKKPFRFTLYFPIYGEG